MRVNFLSRVKLAKARLRPATIVVLWSEDEKTPNVGGASRGGLLCGKAGSSSSGGGGGSGGRRVEG